LTWESSLVRFVELMFATAPNFDEFPTIRDRLANASLTPEKRLADVIAKTTQPEWQAVCDSYDPMAWDIDPVLAPELLERRAEAWGL